MNEVVIASAQPKPGQLGRIATRLSKSGINVTSAYPTESGLAFCVDDVRGARKALEG